MPGMYPYGSVAYGEAPLASGDPIEVLSTRLVAEAITEWGRFHSTASRVAVEVLAPWDRFHTATTRVVVETIGSGLPSIPPTSIDTLVTRLAVESIGNASSYLTSHAHVGRIALEVIASTDIGSKGLLANPDYWDSTHAMVIDPSNWASGGQFLWHEGGSARLRVYGNASTTTVLLTDGSATVSASFSTPSTPVRLIVRSGNGPSTASIWVNGTPISTSWSGTDWLYAPWSTLNGQSPVSYPASGLLAELMLWDRSLTDPEAAYIDSYLQCKWISSGCNPYSDLGPAP